MSPVMTATVPGLAAAAPNPFPQLDLYNKIHNALHSMGYGWPSIE